MVYWLDYGLDNLMFDTQLRQEISVSKTSLLWNPSWLHSGSRVLSLEVKEWPFQPGTSRNITCCITPFRSHLSRDIRGNWESLFCDCHLQTFALIVFRAENDLSTWAVVAEPLKSGQQMHILIAVLHFVKSNRYLNT